MALLAFLAALASCTGDRQQTPTAVAEATPAPTVTVAPPSPTPSITPSIIPLPSLTPTATTTPTVEPSPTPLPCLDPEGEEVIVPEREEPLRIFYASGNQAGIWQEETGTAAPIPLPEDAANPRVSADGQLVAFSRPAAEQLVELRLINSDGSDERLLAVISIAEFLARSPEYVVGASLAHNWIANSPKLAYSLVPELDAIGELPYDDVYVVDANNGATFLLIPAGQANALIYSPDGQQVAALTADELRLISTADGVVEHRIPLPLNNWRDQSLSYSPDGNLVAVFTLEGVTLVEPATGNQQNVPLDYTPIGLGHHAALPGIHWSAGSSYFRTVIAGSNDVFEPEATFTVWQIDAGEAMATALNTFTGFVLSAELSLNLDRLAFWKWPAPQTNTRQLYLADVRSGDQILYATGHLTEFLNWNPDSTHFVYWFAEQRQPQLGHLCHIPVPLGAGRRANEMRWLDANDYLTTAGTFTDDRLRGTWELHLANLAGESTPIVALDIVGDYPFYTLLGRESFP